MTTATRETCADKVRQMRQEREEEFRSYESNPELTENDDPALSIDTVQFTKVCLSYGGPADYIEIYHDGAEVQRVVYRFSDWFDTATDEVQEGDALWTYASYIVEGMGY